MPPKSIRKLLAILLAVPFSVYAEQPKVLTVVADTDEEIR